MKDYLLLIHGNANPALGHWEAFFKVATQSEMFLGGSALGDREVLGAPVESYGKIVGFMRFRSDNREKLDELLIQIPVIQHGGSIELIEMEES